MVTVLLSMHLFDGPVPMVVYILAIASFLAMLVSRRWRRWLPIAAGAIVAGFGTGLLLCWLLGDVLNLFGVTLAVASRMWFSAGVAGLFLGVARAVFSHGRFIAIGVAAGLVMALAGGLGLNADLGEYPTVRNLLGIRQYGDLRPPHRSASVSVSGWIAPPDLPSRGRIGSVTIPATVSHFRARPALVYLPPAALVAHPPRLPVLVALSGQPGEPADLFVKGLLGSYLDSYARAHHGLAPIVVVPDQLGAPGRNPMCVDSSLGDSATYLTVDVPAWIRTHLGVLTGPAQWGIAGFSQGGTCAIQLGAAKPGLFGSILDISGEVAPRNGTLRHTIDAGFGGSRRGYRTAQPADIMAAKAPYRGTFALFAVGSEDDRYGSGLESIAAAATDAGMAAQLFISPGTAHDWLTVQYAFARMIPAVSQHWKLDD